MRPTEVVRIRDLVGLGALVVVIIIVVIIIYRR
jgi:hypothetical protein